MHTTSSSALKFQITLAATVPLATQYFQSQAIEFDVVNTSGKVLFIKDMTLQFEADTGGVPNYVDASLGLRLIPNKRGRVIIDVQPLPLYPEFTTKFDVLLKYHADVHGRLGKLSTERHGGFYIMINTPPPTLGNVFVSFKQPEDQRLANILERYLRRAGFTPNLFGRNPPVGSDQWKSIERLIKHCHSMFVVWGRRTEWGEGVGKEIKLCRSRRMREILLIEEGLPLPSPYQRTAWVYKRYDADEPAHALSKAVSSLREQVIGSQRRSKHSA